MRQTFTERLPGVLKPFARRTNRLTDKLCGLGQALGGEAGSRRAADLAMPISPDTLLRLVRHSDLPSSATPTVLGVDDFAWKKGRTYGTILVDLERHQVVDLLPDRSADSLVEWLLTHPGVKVISRDRGGIYAEGARRGAPDAEQVADRFHLLKNLREALEPLLNREHAHLPRVAPSATSAADRLAAADLALPGAESAVAPALSSNQAPLAQEAGISIEISGSSAAAETASPEPQTRAARSKSARRAHRQARYQEIIGLHEQGTSLRGIAQQMGVGRHTVRRYIAVGSFPEITQRRQMPSILDPFEPYLRQRWLAGYQNALQLYREICDQGYSGSRPLVSHWAAQLRKTMPRRTRPGKTETARTAPQPPGGPIENRRKLSPSQAAWLLVCKPADLKLEQKAALEQMCQASSEISVAYDLAQGFANMVREHKAEPLTTWLENAKNCCLNELHSFANGIQRDLAAVTAGLSSPWSNGQVEGQVNRLKFLKRAMYGRAKFDLLKHRTISGANEQTVCIGDVYQVGSARVQVSASRVPCSKQERKLRLPGFLKRVQETRRTGWYLRVLTPGEVAAGDELRLESRPAQPHTIEALNENWHGRFDPGYAEELLRSPELAEGWKEMLRDRLARGQR